MSFITSSRVLKPVGTAGTLFAFFLDVLRALFKRPFQLREYIQQSWFIASVTIIPTALVAIPFGAVIALIEGWGPIVGFYYFASNMTGLGNPLTNRSPATPATGIGRPAEGSAPEPSPPAASGAARWPWWSAYHRVYRFWLGIVTPSPSEVRMPPK